MANYREKSDAQLPTMAEMYQRMRSRPRVTIGKPMRSMTLDPVTIQVPGGQAAGGQGPVDPQANMDPRAAQLRALMSQGLTFEQAMRRVQAGG